jgi:parallel beta-helix repeat protein
MLASRSLLRETSIATEHRHCGSWNIISGEQNPVTLVQWRRRTQQFIPPRLNHPSRQPPRTIDNYARRLGRCAIAIALVAAVTSCKSSPTSPSDAQKDYYVSLTGSDDNRGTLSSPLRTIGAGLKLLRAGDTLHIRGGVYTGTENAIDVKYNPVASGRSWADPITIAGHPGEAVIIRPPFNVSAIALRSASHAYIILRDLTADMVNSTAGSDADGVFLYRAHHIRFERVEVMNGYNFGVHFDAETPFNEFINCRIHDNGYPGGPATNGHGLYITGSDNLFEGNEVYNNHGYGFHIYNNAGSRADPSRNIVRRNRIYGNGRHGGTAYGLTVAWGDANRIEENQIYNNPGGIQVYTDSTNTDVSNNTVYNNMPLEGIIVQYATGTQVRNNTVYANGSNIVDLGTATAVTQNAITTGVPPGR